MNYRTKSNIKGTFIALFAFLGVIAIAGLWFMFTAWLTTLAWDYILVDEATKVITANWFKPLSLWQAFVAMFLASLFFKGASIVNNKKE